MSSVSEQTACDAGELEEGRRCRTPQKTIAVNILDFDSHSRETEVKEMSESVREQVLVAKDGQEVFVRHWPSAGPTAIVAAHGNGSHSGAYGLMASHLTGSDVYAFDLRGYGASPVRPTEVSDWQGWADDMAVVAEVAAEEGKQVFLLGHSLGSLVALAAAPRVARLAGVILISPSPSSLAMTPEWIGGVMGVLQTQGLAAEVRLPWGPEELVRSAEARAAIAGDPLALRPVTTGMLVQIIGLVEAAQEGGRATTAPALLLLPGEDLLVARSEALRMFDWLASDDKQRIEFPGCYHDLPQDAPQQVASAIAGWLNHLAL